MVCEKCEKKLTKVIVPDKWKDGARNTVGGKDGGAQVGGSSASRHVREKHRKSPMGRACRICKSGLPPHQHYCQQCAYKKGICSMCGRKVADTKSHKMSS